MPLPKCLSFLWLSLACRGAVHLISASDGRTSPKNAIEMIYTVSLLASPRDDLSKQTPIIIRPGINDSVHGILNESLESSILFRRRQRGERGVKGRSCKQDWKISIPTTTTTTAVGNPEFSGNRASERTRIAISVAKDWLPFERFYWSSGSFHWKFGPRSCDLAVGHLARSAEEPSGYLQGRFVGNVPSSGRQKMSWNR